MNDMAATVRDQRDGIPVSVFLITKNCAQWLDEVLSAVSGFAEIVIVDSGSTDETLAIAKRHGAHVVHQEFLGYGQQKQVALDLCTQPWVLNLDGDEVIADTTNDAGRATVTLPGGDWWVTTRAPVLEGELYWNVPVPDTDTLRLDESNATLRPRL